MKIASSAMEMHPGTSEKRTGIYRTGLENPVTDTEGSSVIVLQQPTKQAAIKYSKPDHYGETF